MLWIRVDLPYCQGGFSLLYSCYADYFGLWITFSGFYYWAYQIKKTLHLLLNYPTSSYFTVKYRQKLQKYPTPTSTYPAVPTETPSPTASYSSRPQIGTS